MRSRRSTARPDSFSVPRSPPEPLTHSSSTGSPVTGSVSVPFADALPPAEFVFFGSAPGRLGRVVRWEAAGLVVAGFLLRWLLSLRRVGRERRRVPRGEHR